MQILGKTTTYQAAVDALHTLKAQLGSTPELKAIAALLMVAHDAQAPERVFSYVGDPSDPRDRAIVRVYQDELDAILTGEDGDEW